jgi:hypothetical protein
LTVPRRKSVSHAVKIESASAIAEISSAKIDKTLEAIPFMGCRQFCDFA